MRVDLLAQVSDAARELWDACGIGVVFVDSAFAKAVDEDMLVRVRLEDDVAGRIGVYSLVFTEADAE